MLVVVSLPWDRWVLLIHVWYVECHTVIACADEIIGCFGAGEIVLPHYRHAFSGASSSYFASAARGLFTGQKFPMTLGSSFPAKLPWYFISPKEYWHLCYDSIVPRGKDNLK
ncbi:unnamed protein product [Rhodiola kirilowii]